MKASGRWGPGGLDGLEELKGERRTCKRSTIKKMEVVDGSRILFFELFEFLAFYFRNSHLLELVTNVAPALEFTYI